MTLFLADNYGRITRARYILYSHPCRLWTLGGQGAHSGSGSTQERDCSVSQVVYFKQFSPLTRY